MDDTGKQPRAEPPGVPARKPLWGFRIVDLGGPWCWSALDSGGILEVLGKLRDYESMTWREIEGASGSHFVEVSSLARSARQRLVEIRQDDVDMLFSLRVTGRRRVWGIRSEHVLLLLWWDPSTRSAPLRRSTPEHREGPCKATFNWWISGPLASVVPFVYFLPPPEVHTRSRPSCRPVPSFSDFIVFVDESGDHGLESIDPSYPVFVLAFCVFAKHAYVRHFGHEQVILHEHDIRKSKGAFAFLVNAERRDAFLAT